MKKIIAITGTPGVGKSKVAHDLVKYLSNAIYISANDIVIKYKLYSGTDSDGTKIVKLKALEKSLNEIARKAKGDFIIFEGHLLADIKIKGAVAIVLREHLATLLRIYKKRGYSKAKIIENLISEAIDYCGVHAASNYKNVYEFFSRDPKLKKKLIAIASGKSIKKDEIELLEELLPFIKNGIMPKRFRNEI